MARSSANLDFNSICIFKFQKKFKFEKLFRNHIILLNFLKSLLMRVGGIVDISTKDIPNKSWTMTMEILPWFIWYDLSFILRLNLDRQ
jgi:hypothetical protein